MVNAIALILRQSGAIALAALRQTIHSGTAFWMFLASIATAAGLPMVLRGDNTAGSTLRLAMTYPPIMLFMILLTGTTWMAAAAMAGEIEDGEMASVIIKPVNTSIIWFGKWIGILLLNAGLLATFAALFIPAITIMAHRENDRASLSQLGGHQEFHPEDDVHRREARERLSALRLTSPAGGELSFEQMLAIVKAEAFCVAPARTHTWQVPLPRSKPLPGRTIHPVWDMQFMFRCDPLNRSSVSGIWTLTLPGKPALEVPVDRILDGRHQVSLPPDASLHGPVTITFSNRTESSTVYFDTRAPIALRLLESNFHENLLRALFVLFCFIAAAAALAITMGVLYSLPVATFTVLTFFFAITVSAAFAVIPPPDHVHGAVMTDGLLTHTGEFLLFQLNRATSATLQLLPLASLPDARHISNRQIVMASARLLVGIPALLCAFSAVLLRRREYS